MVERYPILLSVLFALAVLAGVALLRSIVALSIVMFLVAAALLTWRFVIAARRGRRTAP